jgi:hypothetical protein
MASSSNVNFAYLTLTVGLYTMLTITGIGVVTNLLNIRVCLGKHTRKTTMGFYNLLIAPINISALIISLFTRKLANDWSCLLIPYTQRVLFQMISWINVMVSFDRLYLITYHLNNPNATRQRPSNINIKSFHFMCSPYSWLF